MAGSPIFSVNFTNRENSAVLNYHKSWSWSNQPVLWDFYTCIMGCSLLFSIQSMAWQATFDVITSWPFMRPPWKTGGKSLHAHVSSLLELKYTSLHFTSCRRYDETKKLFCTRLSYLCVDRNNIEFSVFVVCHWVDCEIYWEYRTASQLSWPFSLRANNKFASALITVICFNCSRN